MEQLKNEDEFCGLRAQHLDMKLLLQDDDAFESIFFPPTLLDYNLTNINELVDFDELHSILNEGEVNQGHDQGGSCHGSTTTMVTTAELMNVKPKLNNEQHVIKKWCTRKRHERGSKEAAEKKELHKIKNREAAARAFEEKKAYIKWLEVEVEKFRKKNADMKRLLLVLAGSSIGSDMARKQLRRTASGLL
ncbi:hypothetical protein ES319_D12G147000v1 [Gossypium barbadense]|uniref:BZIP domain-containing protein n=2 Tax=Gossypium TaxID=3633 RepID=A0A5J5NXZ3_GOSBA|nr:hypothetical protein ES319_D12G147000v1 [Gossypium barbadense]TYG41185.1 hypothetical protein ES288_D12G155800v1 [Gossypium darwinii]